MPCAGDPGGAARAQYGGGHGHECNILGEFVAGAAEDPALELGFSLQVIRKPTQRIEPGAFVANWSGVQQPRNARDYLDMV